MQKYELLGQKDNGSCDLSSMISEKLFIFLVKTERFFIVGKKGENKIVSILVPTKIAHSISTVKTKDRTDWILALNSID